jgi:hypothetical protein
MPHDPCSEERECLIGRCCTRVWTALGEFLFDVNKPLGQLFVFASVYGQAWIPVCFHVCFLPAEVRQGILHKLMELRANPMRWFFGGN